MWLQESVFTRLEKKKKHWLQFVDFAWVKNACQTIASLWRV